MNLNDAVEKSKEHDLERKTLEEEFNATYAALNSAAIGVIITDKKGNIPYANPALLRMFDYEREKRVGGKHAAEWLAPPGRSHIQRAMTSPDESFI